MDNDIIRGSVVLAQIRFQVYIVNTINPQLWSVVYVMYS